MFPRSLVLLVALAACGVGVEPESKPNQAAVLLEAVPKTDRLGGVDIPSAERLLQMHQSSFILHAWEGTLTEIPVRKTRLPQDPEANPQSIQMVKASDGTIYANLATIICKSTDNGERWTSHSKGGFSGHFEVLRDGTFVGMTSEGEHPDTRVVTFSSSDEGRTWERISEIENPPGFRSGVGWMFRQPDESILAGVGHSDYVFEEVTKGRLVLKSGGGAQWAYLSSDKGRSWKKLGLIHDWLSEGGVALTPAGKLIGAIRFQRPTLPDDPPDLEEVTGSISPGWPFKHVFLLESEDGGKSWKNFRPLTTVFGQTRGFPVSLEDGTVVVIHDTRYGPGSPGSRAMISRDGGQSWEDEVYYLDVTTFTGSYAASVVLQDGEILSVVGSSQAGNNWKAVKGNTDFVAIRWKPVLR
jgi:photosystem II stability/assembly factor-like uncharacterized protein